MMEQGSWFHVVSHHWVWRVSFCRFWLRWGYQGTIIFFFKLVNIMSGAWWVQTQLSKDEEYMVCNLFFSKTISLGCKWIIRNFQNSVRWGDIFICLIFVSQTKNWKFPTFVFILVLSFICNFKTESSLISPEFPSLQFPIKHTCLNVYFVSMEN